MYPDLTKKIASLDNTSKNIPSKEYAVGIWAVALTSFFWSCSSLIVFSLLPAFLTDELGASKTKVGLIEGTAIFMMFVSKVFSGVLSDYWRSRKQFIILGSALNVIIKPMFALAISINWVFAARFIDRLSRGIRAAPTDALIADFSPRHKTGISYGIRQSLYTLGAVVGSGIATCCMHLTNNNYRFTFAISTIPALIALLIIIFIVRQPVIGVNPTTGQKIPWKVSDIKFLPLSFWFFLFITSILMLARFSEAFLTLRAKEVGWSIKYLPILFVVNDLVHAAVAIPVGKLADKMNRERLLMYGVSILFLTNLVIINFPTKMGALVGVMMAGLHMGVTHSLLSALVAQFTPSHLRGTAFSLFYIVSGLSVLLGNYFAGAFSDYYGLSGAFKGGAVFTGVVLMILLLKKNKNSFHIVES